jgi:hypothetical protein
MDKDNKGYITFHDFCELADEKRRGIIDVIGRPNIESFNDENMFKQYLKGADVTELEMLGQW